MQRNECHNFAARMPDWVIENELYEKGVSGFKISANDREAMNELRKAARAKKFDVLLVFMFDRIGRRTDETPFIVKWFVDQGVEVWSTREGQRRFENHVDELMAFIDTWQASGESKKTALRISAGKATMAEQGHYSGGYVPYGYDAVDRGRKSKKGYPVRDLVINEDERAVVETIFRMIVDEGWGTYKVAQHLNAQHIATKRGTAHWRATSIRSIIGNSIYVGRMKVKGELSDEFPDLRIIDDYYFKKALEIVKSRAPKMDGERHGALRNGTCPRGLLTGLIHCGECGSRMTFNHNEFTRTLASGEKRTYERDSYRCSMKNDHKGACTGPSTYTAGPIEGKVLRAVEVFFLNVKKRPKEEMLNAATKRSQNVVNLTIKQAEAALVKAKNRMASLEEQVLQGLTGEAQLDLSIVSQLILKQREVVAAAQETYEHITAELFLEAEQRQVHEAELERIFDWADSFEQANHERKCMILAVLIDKVHIFANGKVKIEFGISAKQFFDSGDMASDQVS